MTTTGVLVIAGIGLLSTFLRTFMGKAGVTFLDILAFIFLGFMFFAGLFAMMIPGIPAKFGTFWIFAFAAYYAGFLIRRRDLLGRWSKARQARRSMELEDLLFKAASEGEGVIMKSELVEISNGYAKTDVLEKLRELKQRGFVEESLNAYVFKDFVR